MTCVPFPYYAFTNKTDDNISGDAETCGPIILKFIEEHNSSCQPRDRIQKPKGIEFIKFNLELDARCIWVPSSHKWYPNFELKMPFNVYYSEGEIHIW